VECAGAASAAPPRFRRKRGGARAGHGVAVLLKVYGRVRLAAGEER
jgi:hypothetical protein